MSYLQMRGRDGQVDGFGCGPSCNCGPCKNKFSGFSETYVAADDDDEQEPEQAPPDEHSASNGEQDSDRDSAPQAKPAAVPGTGPNSRPDSSPGISIDPLAPSPPRRPGRPRPRQLHGFGFSRDLGYFGRPVSFGYYGNDSSEQVALRAALARGERNPNTLTNMLFFARHPERRGARLRRDETNLVHEWIAIRDGWVRSALASASGSAPASPSPGATSSAPTGGTFKQRLVQLAVQEWNRWNRGATKENDPNMRSVLEDYWKTGVGWLPSEPSWWSAVPWSAAFISWLMRKAGAGNAFSYSAGHATYIKAAKENRLTNNNNPFKASRVSEVAPSVGDLVCKSSAGSGATYDNIAPGRASHCDVVTAIEPGKLVAIGGNVSDSVSQTMVPIDASGFIQAPG